MLDDEDCFPKFLLIRRGRIEVHRSNAPPRYGNVARCNEAMLLQATYKAHNKTAGIPNTNFEKILTSS